MNKTLHMAHLVGTLAIIGTGCTNLSTLLNEPTYKPPVVAPKDNESTPKSSGWKTVTITNKTDATICELYVRMNSLADAYAWSINHLKNGPTVTIAPGATIQLNTSAKGDRPDVMASDCSGNPVMRTYENASFAAVEGATWVIERQDQGARGDVQKARGIQEKGTRIPQMSGGSSSSTITIKLVNKCGSSVKYCRQRPSSGSSYGNASVSGNSTSSVDVDAGDKITLVNGSNCGTAVFTADSSSSGQEVVLCK